MTAVAVIPARYASTRLPGKPIVDIAGKPMIQHVYERTERATTISRVVVACDDERIRDAVLAFGGEAIMTSPDCRSGTDRAAEAMRDIEADIIANVQGDEPLIDPDDIDLVVGALREDPSCVMSTAMHAITRAEDLDDPSCVKVVVDRSGYALYFSRSRIPHCRGAKAIEEQPVYRHLGLYAYRRDFLFTYAELEETPLQVAEALEQLRALENGYRIRCILTTNEAVGVDTPEDLERVRRMLER